MIDESEAPFAQEAPAIDGDGASFTCRAPMNDGDAAPFAPEAPVIDPYAAPFALEAPAIAPDGAPFALEAPAIDPDGAPFALEAPAIDPDGAPFVLAAPAIDVIDAGVGETGAPFVMGAAPIDEGVSALDCGASGGEASRPALVRDAAMRESGRRRPVSSSQRGRSVAKDIRSTLRRLVGCGEVVPEEGDVTVDGVGVFVEPRVDHDAALPRGQGYRFGTWLGAEHWSHLAATA